MKSINKNQRGFTLIELIIVIAIMGILAAVLVPSFTQMTAKARVSADLRSIQQLQRQLDLYAAEQGTYPATVSDAIKELESGQYIENKSGTPIPSGALTDQQVVEIVGLQSKAPLMLKNKSTDANAKVFKLKYESDTTKQTITDKILHKLENGPDKDLITNS